MSTTVVIGILMPVVVFIVTWLVTLLKKDIPGSFLVGIIVPGLSLLSAWVATIVLPAGTPYWETALFGLGSVFINELLEQIKTTTPTTPPSGSH